MERGGEVGYLSRREDEEKVAKVGTEGESRWIGVIRFVCEVADSEGVRRSRSKSNSRAEPTHR